MAIALTAAAISRPAKALCAEKLAGILSVLEINLCHKRSAINFALSFRATRKSDKVSPVNACVVPKMVIRVGSCRFGLNLTAPLLRSTWYPVRARAAALTSSSVYRSTPNVNSSINSRPKFSFGATSVLSCPSNQNCKAPSLIMARDIVLKFPKLFARKVLF